MGTETLKRLVAFDCEAAREIQGLFAGVDEAGRGPLAGPVVAAAVILRRSGSLSHLDDSKKIPSLKRTSIFREILQHSLVGIGIADEAQIDEINIYQATRVAMRRAVLSLTRTPDFLFIDGKISLDLPVPQKSIVQGDAKSASIAAASIIAKVFRDGWMQRLAEIYPHYGFEKHKGYGTPLHLSLLEKIGPSPVHRKSFYPVSMLCGGFS
ncbi:MAG: ribonuclease HII [Candidatus Omnitrophica bacterium]|nr:ribonuclease HII [Candidatus Omnitrophota bacterium]